MSNTKHDRPAVCVMFASPQIRRGDMGTLTYCPIDKAELFAGEPITILDPEKSRALEKQFFDGVMVYGAITGGGLEGAVGFLDLPFDPEKIVRRNYVPK